MAGVDAAEADVAEVVEKPGKRVCPRGIARRLLADLVHHVPHAPRVRHVPLQDRALRRHLVVAAENVGIAAEVAAAAGNWILISLLTV